MTWAELVELIRQLGGHWRTFTRIVKGVDSIPATRAVPATKDRAARPAVPGTPGVPERSETVYEITLPDENNVLRSIGEFVNPDEAEATLGAFVMQRFERAATKKAAVEEKKAKEAETKQEIRDREERRRADVQAAAETKKAEATAKAAREAQAQQAAAPYSNPSQPPQFAPPAGQRWQWDEARKAWTPVEITPRQPPRTMEEALTRGTEQEINAFMEARRLDQELSPAEQEQQAYNRQRQAQTDQLSLFDRQLEIARSPGDYALWWDMLTRGQDVTPQDFADFQRSGVRSSLYPQSQPLEADQGLGQPSLAPTPNETYDKAAAALQAFMAGGGTQGMSPQQLEITNQAWTERIRRAEALAAQKTAAAATSPAVQMPADPLSVLTAEERAKYNAFVDAGNEETADALLRQAQDKWRLVNAPRFSAERPQPGALSLGQAKAAGTLPSDVLFPGLARQFPSPQTQVGGAPAPRPDFMRLLFNRQNLQTPPRRTIANITGQPLPSGQMFNRLMPSQQQGYLASYAPGVPREDFLNEFQRTTAGFPNMPRRLLFRPPRT